MPQFLLILRSDESQEMETPSPDDFAAIVAKYQQWAEGLGSRGLLLEGQKLMDGEGRVLSPTDGGMTVKDGPYVETKEVVGGFYLVKADSYEQVIELCRDHPHITHFGSIEVRAVDSLGEGEGA